MSNYMIFVVVLTIAYIIYYGYNISKDLYGKKPEDSEEKVETFDVGDMEAIVATPVRESDGGGFSLGGVPANPVDMPETESDSSEHNDNAEAKKMIGDMTGRFEDADTYSEGGVTYTELDEMIGARDPKLKFVPTIRQHRDIY